MAEKRYWWLKLKEDFFRQKLMKKMRRMDNGATMTIIYLKMQLESLRNGGVICFDKTEDTFENEMAYTLDEDVKDVKATIDFLINYGLMIELSDTENALIEVEKNIGSEASSAVRMRNLRSKASQCNEKASQCDKVTSQCNGNSVTSLRRYREDIEQHKYLDKSEKKTPAPELNISLFGTYKNIRLSDTELQTLELKYDDWQDKINNLSAYMKSSGKEYSSHYATICKWAEEDKDKHSKQNTSHSENSSFDIQKFDKMGYLDDDIKFNLPNQF